MLEITEFQTLRFLSSAPSKMHLRTGVHFVWNMIEGIEPPTFSHTVLRIDFRPKCIKQIAGTEVRKHTGNETSALNA